MRPADTRRPSGDAARRRAQGPWGALREAAPGAAPASGAREALAILHDLRERDLWPNGARHLWTDAFGLVVLLSLHRRLGDAALLAEAEWLVGAVHRRLGRPRGLGFAEGREGQHFRTIALWLYALARLAEVRPDYRTPAVGLAREVHAAFVVPGAGLHWKMDDDLRHPLGQAAPGPLDAYAGTLAFRALDGRALAPEIAELARFIEASHATLAVDQDIGLGMMLWIAHFFPGERWAEVQTRRSLDTLGRMWIEPPGCFCRAPGFEALATSFGNHAIALGLRAAGAWPDRSRRVLATFEGRAPAAHPEAEAMAGVMECAARFPGLLLRNG